jgi:hypothetical protein
MKVFIVEKCVQEIAGEAIGGYRNCNSMIDASYTRFRKSTSTNNSAFFGIS